MGEEHPGVTPTLQVMEWGLSPKHHHELLVLVSGSSHGPENHSSHHVTVMLHIMAIS